MSRETIRPRTSRLDIAPVRRVAKAVARADVFPTALRAVLGYYGDTGQLSVRALQVRRRVETVFEEILQDLFGAVEEALAAELRVPPARVTFQYDTKLTLPAELTLGYVYYRARRDTPAALNPVTRSVRTPLWESLRRPFGDGDDSPRRERLLTEAADELALIDQAEAVTELVVAALIDGDMRDAVNDDEFGDFDVTVEGDSAPSGRQVATIAQETLQDRVETRFAAFESTVEAAYDRAVAVSEGHQDQDPHFRDLMTAAQEGDPDALDAIRGEYKAAEFDEPPEMFAESDLDLPYLKTQYDRVGVIYDGMIEMYRAADVPVDPAFKRSVVLAIIGAQVWLDDIDDYTADTREGQLTPVTAEYLLAESDAAAYNRVVSIATDYLDRAKRYAAASDSPLAGIGADYIYRSGDPAVLPR